MPASTETISTINGVIDIGVRLSQLSGPAIMLLLTALWAFGMYKLGRAYIAQGKEAAIEIATLKVQNSRYKAILVGYMSKDSDASPEDLDEKIFNLIHK